MNLPATETWRRLDQGEMEFRRVTFPAEFLHDQEALVYAAGSTLRPEVTPPGYWVFTPARLTGGSLVVVNRGFGPEGRQRAGTRAEGQLPGVVDLVGALRWPEARGMFTPADQAGKNLWFVRDHEAIAAAKGWGAVAPFFIEQEAPAAPGGLPQAGRIQPNLPDNHLQYAVTWYGLALVLIVIFVVRLRSGRSATSE
jgi:surfeit locus 1 family protein